MMGILQELKIVKTKKILLKEMKTMLMRKKSLSKIKNIKIVRIIKLTLMKENNDKNYNRNYIRNYISDNDNENESNKANDRISKMLIEKNNKIKTLEEEIADIKEKYNSLDKDYSKLIEENDELH